MMTPNITVEPITAARLVQAGLLQLGGGCQVHPTVVFIPSDKQGTLRQIVLGEQVTIGAYAVLNGGVAIGDHSYVGHHAVLGEPEYGYAVREIYPGAGAGTIIGARVIIRSGAIVYANTTIGDDTTIGHHTLLRTGVHVGASSQLAANLTVERGCRIGSGVRAWNASMPPSVS
jgi:UDP-3-O-[3-hydroxymyristoyl] glucosamine N-acyltransferase